MTAQPEPVSREQVEILTRLRRVEGQIRGIQRMIEDERACEAIVTQLLAARAALDRTGLLIMSQHIEHCLCSASTGDDRVGLERVMSFFLQFARPPESDEQGWSDVGESNGPSQVALEE
jgi:CsoR family transcriptional regulator, copper-sensing transcriptional repressor